MYNRAADKCIVNGRVVNVFTGEILEQNVAISGERIVYVGDSSSVITSGTVIIDAMGDFVTPGFFDAHAHADLYYSPLEYAYFVAAKGTTGFFNDGHDLANALGPAEFMSYMARLQDTPMSVITGVPATSPPYPGIEGDELWTDKDIELASSFDWVVSLSEVSPYPRVLKGEEALLRRIALARRLGLLVEGHTTGASADKLNSLSFAGITSCHESLSYGDVVDRVRLGFHTMLRQGSIRKDLPLLVDAVKDIERFDAGRLMLVSDGIFPDHLVSRGNMDWVVKSAVEEGIAPVRAIQMATINPARYFRLDGSIGSIAPGRLANILLVEDINNPFPRLVMAKGVPIAENGVLTVERISSDGEVPSSRPFARENILRNTFRIDASMGPQTVPAIEIVDQTVTRRIDIEVPVRGGFYRPEGDILSAFLCTRDGSRMGVGFVSGFCRGVGGLASSISHETHGLLVLGQDEEDMRIAASAVLEIGGGIAICRAGRVLCRLELPIGGICSRHEIPQLASEISSLHATLREMGCELEYPLWTLGFLSFTSVLGPRITYSGTYDVRSAKVIFPVK